MRGRSPVVLGIDAGTTSVKTVAFRLDGEIAGLARASLHLRRPAGDRAEMDMESVWQATQSTMVAVLEQIRGADVVAIGVTGQGDGAWLIGTDGRPIGPAVLWLDGRAGRRVAEWQSDGRADAVRAATGSSVFAGALPVLLDELTTEDGDLRTRLWHHVNCKDWIRYRLTGLIATDPSEASRTYLDTAAISYSAEMMTRLSHEWVADLLPPVLPPASVAGEVAAPVALVLGLPAGIPVAVGLVDTVAAGVGLGALADGEAYVILGTTGFVGVNRPDRFAVASDGVMLATGRGQQVLESLAPMTGTPNLDWVRQTLDLEEDEWAAVQQLAADVPVGSGGVVYLPYGSPSGERAPFVDASASAAWLGLSTTTTPAQMLRAVFEGLAFSLTECLDALDVHGLVRICGGGAESDLLCRILADVSGRPIERPVKPEVGARGAAAVAVAAAGIQPDLESAAEALSAAVTRFEPDPSRSELSLATYAAFLELRDAIRPHWPTLASLRRPTASPSTPPRATTIRARPDESRKP